MYSGKFYFSKDGFKLIEDDTFDALKEFDDKSINMIFADPPYFLSSGGITCSGGKMVSVNKGDWDKSLSAKEKYEFNKKWIRECFRILKDEGTIWISGTLHNIYSIGMALEAENFKILNNITWQKSNPPPNLACKTFTHSTETILWAKKNLSKVKYKFNYELMKQMNNNKQMKDVWTTSLTKPSEKKQGKHPTQKPLEILERIVLASTEEHDIILDPFCGSSTTGIAANKYKRNYIGIDNSKEYLDLSIRRYEELEEERMSRNFKDWISEFEDSIASWKYYTDFEKVYNNVNKIKNELNLLNGLIGSKNIEEDFKNLVNEYPNVLKAIPILIAKRENIVIIKDAIQDYYYNFNKMNYSIDDYILFMRKTGIFDLLENHLVSNLYDYVTGVEVGMDTNARKNRTGDAMEDLVESYIVKAGFVKDYNYYKEVTSTKLKEKWNIDLKEILKNIDASTNNKKVKMAEKRFDFVIENNHILYLIETNFYGSQGSKLNETARSYKMLNEELKKIKGVKFVWFTDGKGWNSAKGNLEETFNEMEDIYNIKEMKENIMSRIF